MLYERMRINWSHYARVCEARRNKGLPLAFDMFFAMRNLQQKKMNSLLNDMIPEQLANHPLAEEIIFEKVKTNTGR